MNAIKTPGFTADASLYKASYQFRGNRGYSGDEHAEQRVVSEIRLGGDLGVSIHPTNVAYWPVNGGYRCAGFWDCINMINSENCREVNCETGWVTGEPVCFCST
jgi:hypothetical protein